MYAVLNDRLIKSTNAGATWTATSPLPQGSHTPSPWIRGPRRSMSGCGLTGERGEPLTNSVYRSTDGGRKWQRVWTRAEDPSALWSGADIAGGACTRLLGRRKSPLCGHERTRSLSVPLPAVSMGSRSHRGLSVERTDTFELALLDPQCPTNPPRVGASSICVVGNRFWPCLSPQALHRAQRSTTTTSHVSAVGGKPVSNFALTTASRLPKRAAVAGTWNRSLVMTSSITPEVRSGLS